MKGSDNRINRSKWGQIIHHEEHEKHEVLNTEFDDLSNQVRGKAIELYRKLLFFDPLVSFLPFVSFVVKSDCFLCFSFFIAADISDDIPVAP
jgi:hypothetical protein